MTAGGNDGTPSDCRDTWEGDSWKTGGGGGWMPGSYDPVTDTLWWGTGNPAPLYDWAGDKWKTEGPRPGDNLYTSSVLLLNPDSGELAGRRDLPEGKHTNLCPAIAGGYSWNAGSYSPKTSLLYKVGFEWCMDLEVVRTQPWKSMPKDSGVLVVFALG